MNILNKEQFCEKYNLTSDQFEGKEWVDSLTIDEEFLPEGFNPRVTGYLELTNLKIIPSWFNPVVRWDLYLPSVVSFDPSFDPVVGGWLLLNSLTEIPFGWKPTVSYELFLESITTLPDWFEPVAWRVYFNGDDEYTEKFRLANDFYSWRNGQYIMAGTYIVEVIERIGMVYQAKLFGESFMFYLVTDGNGTFGIGSTLDEAKEKLTEKLG